MSEFSHIDENGNAIMVDVTQKSITDRCAAAEGKIYVCTEIIERILNNTVEKGDVLGVARVAGIMAAKKTSDLIPMCHIIMITKCGVEFEINSESGYIKAVCTVKTKGQTGVEMEALTGVSIALMTIYDMCKAIDKSMVIDEIHLVSKTGGKSGDYTWKEQ